MARKKTAIRAPRCRGCRQIVTWNTIKFVENDLSVYVKERMYFCPHCGVILGLSSWHTIS